MPRPTRNELLDALHNMTVARDAAQAALEAAAEERTRMAQQIATLEQHASNLEAELIYVPPDDPNALVPMNVEDRARYNAWAEAGFPRPLRAEHFQGAMRGEFVIPLFDREFIIREGELRNDGRIRLTLYELTPSSHLSDQDVLERVTTQARAPGRTGTTRRTFEDLYRMMMQGAPPPPPPPANESAMDRVRARMTRPHWDERITAPDGSARIEIPQFRPMPVEEYVQRLRRMNDDRPALNVEPPRASPLGELGRQSSAHYTVNVEGDIEAMSPEATEAVRREIGEMARRESPVERARRQFGFPPADDPDEPEPNDA